MCQAADGTRDSAVTGVQTCALPISPQQVASTATPTGQSSGTFVGRKVTQMRTDLGKLQRSVGDLNKRMTQISSQNIETSRRYHEVVAAMNSRLQVGTTPGNPLLVKQWNEAQHKLEAIVESLGRMDKLSNDAAGDAGLAAWLLDSEIGRASCRERV